MSEPGSATRRPWQRGLTLPEVLLALLIFSLLSAAGVYSLRVAIESREQIGAADKRLAGLMTGRMILKEDLLQLSTRLARDEFGNFAPASFVGGAALAYRPLVDGERPLMAFVRRNWANPGDRAPRSSMQAVEYLLVGDRLVRRVRPYLDDAKGQPRRDVTLVEGVRSARIEFMIGETNSGFSWGDAWPLAGGVAAGAPPLLRLTIDAPPFGSFEQIFFVRKNAS